MLLGELRAWLAGALEFGDAHSHLVDQSSLPENPTPAEQATFSRANSDSYIPGASSLLMHSALALYPIFVDDTSNANICSRILPMVTASVLGAYIIFGFPGNDPWANCPPCINEHKWRQDLTFCTTFLGFEINTCTMTLTWPFDKRLRLHQCIAEVQQVNCTSGHIPCHMLAQVLGLLCNGCFVLPLSMMLSLTIQHTFNDKIKCAMQGPIIPK